MRRLSINRFSILAFLLLSNIAFAVASDDVDVLSYEINAVIENDRIIESVSIHLASKKPLKKLDLTLASVMEITSCCINGLEVPFEQSGWNLELNLRKAGSPKGEFSIQFELEGKPYNNQRNKFIRTNICEDHAYIRQQYAWYPRRKEDPALYDITLKTKKDWLVRTAGDVVEKTVEGDLSVWRFKLKKPCCGTGLAAGPYVNVEQKGEGGVSLNALVFQGHVESAKNLLGFTAQAIKFFTQLFGPMSEKQFTLVEMPPPFGTGSGYGETGYALIGSGAFENDGNASWAESLVAHEVSHTWWGREVGFSNFASEMLATYSTNRYLERFNGKEAAQKERGAFTNRIASTVANGGGVAFEDINGWGRGLDPSVYSAHAYGKGAMVLHILENEMGRSAFDASLKSFFQKHRDQTIDYKTVSKKLGGSKHKWIFKQWGSPEIPTLYEEHEVKKSGSGYGIKGYLFQEGPKKPFKMMVILRAVSGDKSHDHEVEVKKSKTAFKFTCSFDPESIIIDPMHHIIFGKGGADIDVEALTKQAFNVSNSPGQYDKKVLEKAIKDMKKLIELGGGKKSECIAGMGRCLFRLGKYDKAKAELEKAINMRDSGPFWRSWIYLRLGCIADLKKKRSDAIEFYNKAVAVQKGSNTAINQAKQFLKKPYRKR